MSASGTTSSLVRPLVASIESGPVIIRTLCSAVVLATLGVALSASPAVAFDHHFQVIPNLHSPHFQGNHIDRFRATLFDPHPGQHHDRVGHSRMTCRDVPHRLRCHVVIHLNGQIGGRGDIKAVGDISHRDNRLNVVGGTGEFNGVAGKLLVHPGHWHFDLTR
jgi:hypothetical protein